MGRNFTNLEEQLTWARKELEIVKEEMTDPQIYEDAVATFDFMMNHSKMPGAVINVLKMIIDGELLSPIRDVDSEFDEITDGIFQSKRWPSMHYLLEEDSKKKFIVDSDMVLTVDIHNPELTIFEPFAMSYFYRECLRLTFPYNPPEYPWIIYIERCKASTKEYYDTMGICYAKLPGEEKLLEIKKFFKLSPDTGIWEEILLSEYAFRCKKGGLLDHDR